MRPRRFLRLVPPLVVLAAGCVVEDGSAADATSLFAVPKSATTNSTEVTGVWETSQPSKTPPITSTTRFEIRADHLLVGTRCTMDDGSASPITVGAQVDAEVSSSEIVIRQPAQVTQSFSGASGTAQCVVALNSGTLPACAASTPESQRTSCFALTNGVLTLYQSQAVAFVKIAD